MAALKECLMQTSCRSSRHLHHSDHYGIIVVTFTDSSVAEEWDLPLFSVVMA